jgi:hypothetical protein
VGRRLDAGGVLYADGCDGIRGQEARPSTAAALCEVRIRRLPDAMARAEWQVPRQRMRRYWGRHASRNAHRVPVAARAPGLGLTHALQKRHQSRRFRVSYDFAGSSQPETPLNRFVHRCFLSSCGLDERREGLGELLAMGTWVPAAAGWRCQVAAGSPVVTSRDVCSAGTWVRKTRH